MTRIDSRVGGISCKVVVDAYSALEDANDARRRSVARKRRYLCTSSDLAHRKSEKSSPMNASNRNIAVTWPGRDRSIFD